MEAFLRKKLIWIFPVFISGCLATGGPPQRVEETADSPDAEAVEVVDEALLHEADSAVMHSDTAMAEEDASDSDDMDSGVLADFEKVLEIADDKSQNEKGSPKSFGSADNAEKMAEFSGESILDLRDEQGVLPTIVVDEFSVNKDTSLGPVLRALARIVDVNIVFSDVVENMGPFRFRLNKPTPWDKVLLSILEVNHLTHEVHGGIITIMTIEDVNNRYEMEKQKSDQIELKLRQEAQAPLSLKVVDIEYIKAEQLVEPLVAILKQSAREDGFDVRGSVSADKTSNSLILHAPTTEIDKLMSVIEAMDRKTRQIRIEASLVEVSSQFAYELGIKWSFHANGSLRDPYETRSPAEVSPMSMDQEGQFDLSDATYKTMQGLVDSAAGTVDYGIIDKDFALGMNLKALEEDGKLKILSRPSLTTSDNRKAIIKSGSEIPYRTEDDEGRPVVEYKEAVLSLDVLPQIVDDIAIYMDVAITKDEPDFSQTVDGNPVVLKKFVESRMMVLDGQTAVIAGLTKNSTFDKDGGIPYLRKIPYIGRLFSAKIKQDSEEELMIFLTPRIVPNTALDNSEVIGEWMRQVYYSTEGKSLTERQREGVGFVDVDSVQLPEDDNERQVQEADE